MSKINDLSNSALRKRFFDTTFVPENNIGILSIRVSSKKQERGESFAEQMEVSNEYIKNEKLQITKIWKVSETASKHALRKHFHEMLEFIKASQETNNPIKHVVFSHQSRSNRNQKSARELEDLVDMGITLHFARDKRKLTCRSDITELLMWYVENIKNQSEVKDLTRNTMGGTIKVIERGMSPIGVPPFGLRAEGRKDKRRWILDGDKALYMKKGFEIVIDRANDFAKGRHSDEALKEELDLLFPQINETPDKKNFCRLLRNPHFCGDIRYAGEVYKGNPEFLNPLISKEMWCQVQDILEGRHKKRRLSKDHDYIGMMKCAGKIIDENGNLTNEVCGCAITAEKQSNHYKNGTSQDFFYYRCSNNTRPCSQLNK